MNRKEAEPRLEGSDLEPNAAQTHKRPVKRLQQGTPRSSSQAERKERKQSHNFPEWKSTNSHCSGTVGPMRRFSVHKGGQIPQRSRQRPKQSRHGVQHQGGTGPNRSGTGRVDHRWRVRRGAPPTWRGSSARTALPQSRLQVDSTPWCVQEAQVWRIIQIATRCSHTRCNIFITSA